MRLASPSVSTSRPAARIGGALCALSLFAPRPAAAAEPTSCLSPDPSAWPAASKPYFMLLVDTSGSMISPVPAPPAAPQAPSCTGYDATRMGHARCAVKNTVLAFSGEVNFGLGEYASFMSGCSATCYGNASNKPIPRCDLKCFTAELNQTGGVCEACGPLGTIGDATTRRGANILVGMQVDDFWSTTPSATNVPQILKYVDNDCTNNLEITSVPTDGQPFGKTPLNGALRDMKRYFQTGWTNPDTGVTIPTPLDVNDRACRSVNVILLTDGDETCDTQQNAVSAAASLFTGVTVGGKTFKIKTHVINFAGGNQTNTDAIAAAGGTGSSYFATNEVQLSQALSNIVSGAIKPETCDNTDNNCNGCTDEGFKHFCDVQPVATNCCVWTTQAQRTACLATYQSSITAANPKGNVALLPCTTAAQQQDPASWLCFDPGERCDNADNNCQSGVDEGIAKCGSPAHCPQAETCNGQDDDCDGVIDNGGVCPFNCVPKPEICDGCDNDCDGIVDNGIAAIPCGQASPPNCAGSITCKAVAGTVTPGACVAGGGFNTCSNSPQPETCDGLDNNCNGIVDDGITAAPCVPAGTPGGIVFGGASQCKRGTQACGGACVGFVGPSAEICDGIDNDCDGQIDEGAVGVGQSCGVTQLPCTPGTTACVGGALVCQGGLQPKPEVCDGKDNDCDGQVDETPLADAPASGQNGCWGLPGNCCHFPDTNPTVSWCPPPGASCYANGTLTPPCNKGTLTCSGSGGWTCSGAQNPAAEVCDGIDNDCNGKVDDGSISQVGQVCGSNIGDCKPGVLACTAGVLDCVGDVPATAEICDGKDNDCDGQIDNGIPTGGPCSLPYDTAAYPGDRTAAPCQPGILQCNGMGGLTCVGGVGPSPELCDGIDNDCDGQVDETGATPDGINGSQNPLPPPGGAIGDACGVSVGECKQGAYACVNGLFSCIGSQQKAPEVCDCLDNDCDGKTDNPAPGGPALCGSGKDCVKSGTQCQCAPPCSPQGEFPCPGGQTCVEVNSSETGAAAGFHCVADPCASCGTATVKNGKGDVVCAPAGTTLPGCVTPPICICKGQNGCQEPCVGVTCPSGQVCTDFGPNAGKCVVDNCFNAPCQGCGKACNLGSCVDNPCASMSCPAGQACKPSGDFSTATCVPSCASVTCASGQACVNGACVDGCSSPCPTGQVCNLAASPPACVADHCQPNPCADGSYCDPATGACGNSPCEGVVCPTGETCSAGQCVSGGGSSSSSTSVSTSASTGASTASASSSGSGAGGSDGSIWGLPTGGGGCTCATTPAPSRSSGAQLLLLVAAAAVGHRRRRGREKRAAGEEVSR